MRQMEQHLQESQNPESEVTSPENSNLRTTRGLKLSAKYTELLPRARREEMERETTPDATSKIVTVEVYH